MILLIIDMQPEYIDDKALIERIREDIIDAKEAGMEIVFIEYWHGYIYNPKFGNGETCSAGCDCEKCKTLHTYKELLDVAGDYTMVHKDNRDGSFCSKHFEDDEYLVCGIYTWQCVKETVSGLLEKGKKVFVRASCCSNGCGVYPTPEHTKALKAMYNSGATLLP